MSATVDIADAAARLGRAVSRRRRALGVTQADLAALAGVSTRSVTALEAGKPTTRLDIVLPVLAALGIDLVAAAERR